MQTRIVFVGAVVGPLVVLLIACSDPEINARITCEEALHDQFRGSSLDVEVVGVRSSGTRYQVLMDAESGRTNLGRFACIVDVVDPNRSTPTTEARRENFLVVSLTSTD